MIFIPLQDLSSHIKFYIVINVNVRLFVSLRFSLRLFSRCAVAVTTEIEQTEVKLTKREVCPSFADLHGSPKKRKEAQRTLVEENSFPRQQSYVLHSGLPGMPGLDADGDGRLLGKQATATIARNMQRCGDTNLTIIGLRVSSKRKLTSGSLGRQDRHVHKRCS